MSYTSYDATRTSKQTLNDDKSAWYWDFREDYSFDLDLSNTGAFFLKKLKLQHRNNDNSNTDGGLRLILETSMVQSTDSHLLCITGHCPTAGNKYYSRARSTTTTNDFYWELWKMDRDFTPPTLHGTNTAVDSPYPTALNGQYSTLVNTWMRVFPVHIILHYVNAADVQPRLKDYIYEIKFNIVLLLELWRTYETTSWNYGSINVAVMYTPVQIYDTTYSGAIKLENV